MAADKKPIRTGECLMTKKTKNDPNFNPESQPRMSEDEKDTLFAHMIRRPQIFEEALGRMPLGTVKDEDDKYLVLLRGCHKLAKQSGAQAGTKAFKSLL